MKRSLIALALAAGLPLSAQAAPSAVSYLYAEVGYTHADVFDDSLKGYDFKGEATLTGNFYALANYSRVRKGDIDSGFVDINNNPILIDINYSQSALGVGYHYAMSDKADWNVEASYVRDDSGVVAHKYGAGNSGENGYRVSTGVRGMLGDKFEGSVYINYTDVNNFGNGVGAGVGGVFHINDTWGITAGYDHAKRDSFDLNTWNVGIRASY